MFRKYGKLCKSHFFIQTKVLIKYITLEFVAAHVQSKWADWLRVDKDIPHPLQLQRQLNSFSPSKMSAATTQHIDRKESAKINNQNSPLRTDPKFGEVLIFNIISLHLHIYPPVNGTSL